MKDIFVRKFFLPAGLLLGVLILALGGCTSFTATPAETLPVLYQLDFEHSDAFSGWHVGGPGTDLLWLENTQAGKYVFEFPSGFLQNWDQALTDIDVSVDVEFQSDKPMDVSVGCRMSADAGYWFSITPDRHWMILKSFNGQSATLAEGDSDTILPDVNRLTARCVGADLTLLVNDVELGSAADSDIPAGGISLGYNTFAAGSGSFDNLIVLDLSAPAVTPDGDQALLYAEMFDDPSALTGWELKSGQTEVKDGAYHLSVENGDLTSFLQGQSFVDTTLTVDLEFLGPDPAAVSIICRKGEGGYSFFLSSDGHWKIDSFVQKLASGDTSDLRAGVNQLVVSCTGSQFTFSLNGVELGSVQDSAFPQGEIGFGLTSDGQAEVAFDNLTVSGSAAQIVEATGTPTPSQVPTAIATGTPTLRPTLIPTQDLVLYQTDFENEDASLAQWRTFAYSFQSHTLETDGYTVTTNTSFYRFVADEVNQRMFAIYDTDLGTSDVDISLHATAPRYEGSVGLVCRYTEAGWYQFMVEKNGIWSVRLVQPDETGLLRFRKIASGTHWLGLNVDLRAECKGDMLNFYIDGVQQAMLHDDTFSQGKVGVLSWSFDQTGQVGFIDRFTVQRVSWSESNIPGPAATPGPDDILYTTDFGNMDALSQYWYTFVRTDILGPGSVLNTHYYINDFDPGIADIEISADLAGGSVSRSLICRYSPDGWYEAFLGHQPYGAYLALKRMEHDANGQLATTWLASRFVNGADVSNLTLTCTGSQLIVSVNGEPFLYAEDGLWHTGRYGLSYISNTPLTPRSSFTSYTAHSADRASIQPGDTILAIVSDTPQEIITDWGLNASDDRLMVQDDSILLTLPPNLGIGLSNEIRAENTELTVDLEFKGESGIHMDCRSESLIPVSTIILNNGDWRIIANYQSLASGNSADIHPGQNLFTMRCVGSQVTLIANGETLTATELPSYMPASGETGMSVENNFSVQLNSITFKVLQPSVSPLVTSVLPNQVSLPVYDEPGGLLYEWASWDFLGVIGGRNLPWSLWYGEQRPTEQNGTVTVASQSKLVEWNYIESDLYDLPLKVSADVTFTGNSGGIGLMCRYTQLGRYTFVVQPGGKWFIRRDTFDWFAPSASGITVLAQGTSDAIQPDANQLTITCIGNELVFFANGTELGRVQDDLYAEGQVGIFFDAYTSGSFTNLDVWLGE